VFEVWDRHRREVVGLADSKADAVLIGANSLNQHPKRKLRDLVIRPHLEPPVRVLYMRQRIPPQPR